MRTLPLLSNVVTYRQTVLDVQHLDVEFVGPAHRYPFRPPANPVVTPARPGDLARTFLADTLTTALDIEAGTAEAWQANRHGPRRALVADALIRVGARLGIDLSGSDHARARLACGLMSSAHQRTSLPDRIPIPEGQPPISAQRMCRFPIHPIHFTNRVIAVIPKEIGCPNHGYTASIRFKRLAPGRSA